MSTPGEPSTKSNSRFPNEGTGAPADAGGVRDPRWMAGETIRGTLCEGVPLPSFQKRGAKEAGVSRENLYRSLNGETKPEFDTIMRVLTALGVQLEAKPKAAA